MNKALALIEKQIYSWFRGTLAHSLCLSIVLPSGKFPLFVFTGGFCNV